MSSSSSCMLIVRCPLVTTETLCGRARCDAAAASPAVINAERRVPLSIIYSVAGPSICFSHRFISRSSIFNSACHAFSQTVCVLFLCCISGFWGMLQYAEKWRKGHNTDSVHCRERKRSIFPISLKSTGFLVNLSPVRIQPRCK